MSTPSANSVEQDPEDAYNDEPPSASAETPDAAADAGGEDGAETVSVRGRSRCIQCGHLVAATVPVASWFLLAVSCISLIFSFFFSAMGDVWLSDMLTLTSAFTFVLSVISFFVSLYINRRLGYFH